MALTANRKRARSAAEKESRREAILTAARYMIFEGGFDGITMSALAERAGLAKGTLYLYFRTKEELRLGLFIDAMETFVDRFEIEARPDDVVGWMMRLAKETPLFLPLLARLAPVIEPNVSGEPLFEARREIAALESRFNAQFARLTGTEPQAARKYTNALLVAMRGAAQQQLSAQYDPDDTPEDVAKLCDRLAFERAFPQIARVILSGLV